MIIVGMMPVFNAEDWVEWAVEGVINFVDELVVVEGYMGPWWHFGSCRSQDQTIPILKRLSAKYDRITLTNSQSRYHVLAGRASTYNHVIRTSRLFNQADWCFISDSDEFYTSEQLTQIHKCLKHTDYNIVTVTARMFFFNFRYYIEQSLNRFIRVTPGLFFKPGQVPHYQNGQPYASGETILQNDPMFHYSFVRRTELEIQRRIMEYCANQRDRRIFEWIDKVYLTWTPENAEAIYAINETITGNRGINFVPPAKPLNKYEGPHPAVLDEHPFRHLDDVRNLSNFGPNERSALSALAWHHHWQHQIKRVWESVRRSLQTVAKQ